jgi:V/A-type H+/Na+-transporting ATPase subunit E
MSPERDGIHALETGIIEQAREEASHILAEAEAKARSIRQQGQAQTDAERSRVLQRVADETRKAHEHLAANAQLEAQKLRLGRREQLLARVFAEARGNLLSIQNRPEYAQVVRRLLREAVEQLGTTDVRVRADRITLEILQAGVLAEAESDLKLHVQVGEPLEKGTGLLVETPDGHRRLDNTLETRLSHMQDSLRASVYHVLVGEQP